MDPASRCPSYAKEFPAAGHTTQFVGSASLEADTRAGCEAARRARRLHITLAWKPAPDFELSIWETTDGNVGGVTILVGSPPPRALGKPTP
jgi:hypothetical protein